MSESTPETTSADEGSGGFGVLVVILGLIAAFLGYRFYTLSTAPSRTAAAPSTQGATGGASQPAPVTAAPGANASAPAAASQAVSGQSPTVATSRTALNSRQYPPELVLNTVIELRTAQGMALTTEQIQRIVPLLTEMEKLASQMPEQAVCETAAKVLQPKQFDLVVAQKSMTPNTADPLVTGAATLTRVAGTAKPVALGAADPRWSSVEPWMILQAIPLLSGDLAISPAQAAALLPAVKQLAVTRSLFWTNTAAIVKLMTAKQRGFLAERLASGQQPLSSVFDALSALDGASAPAPEDASNSVPGPPAAASPSAR